MLGGLPAPVGRGGGCRSSLQWGRQPCRGDREGASHHCAAPQLSWLLLGSTLAGGSPCSACLTIGPTNTGLSLLNGGPVWAALSQVTLGTHTWPSLEAQGQAGQDVLTPWAGGAHRLLGCVWTRRAQEVRESLPGM